MLIGLNYRAGVWVTPKPSHYWEVSLQRGWQLPHGCTDGVPPSLCVCSTPPTLGGYVQLEQNHIQLSGSDPLHSPFYDAGSAMNRSNLRVYYKSSHCSDANDGCSPREPCSTDDCGNTHTTLGHTVCKAKEFTFPCQGEIYFYFSVLAFEPKDQFSIIFTELIRISSNRNVLLIKIV